MYQNFILTLFCFFCLNFASLHAAPQFLEGEELNYDIRWGFMDVGKAVLKTQKINSNQYLLSAYAKSVSSVETFYPVRDTVLTWVDSNLLPIRFIKVLNEGSWRSRTNVFFDQVGLKAKMSDTVLESKSSKVKRSKDTLMNLAGPSHAVTSAFYLTRTLELASKTQQTFWAVSGTKNYKLKVLIQGRETVETPAGKFKCVKVEPILDEDGLFKASGKMTIWLTDDVYKTPVLVKSKISLGSITVELNQKPKRR